jgi:hypothetical protein
MGGVGNEPGEQPTWAKELEQHDLYYGAGLVWCKACSAVATTEKTFTMLRRRCRSTESGWKLPVGSNSRLRRLLHGKHPHGAQRWPDGRDGKTMIKFRKLTAQHKEEEKPQKKKRER